MNYVGFNAICIFLNVISVKKETNRLSQVTTDFPLQCLVLGRKEGAALSARLFPPQDGTACGGAAGLVATACGPSATKEELRK